MFSTKYHHDVFLLNITIKFSVARDGFNDDDEKEFLSITFKVNK
jgi:hypothetical protein